MEHSSDQSQTIEIQTSSRRLEDIREKIYESGVLFAVSCTGTTFTITNKKEDFGLSVVPSGMSLGNKLFLPHHVVRDRNRIQERARRCVRAFSHSFPIDGINFVPRTKILEAEDALEEHRADLEKWKQKTRHHFDDYKAEMLAEADKFDSVHGKGTQPYRKALERAYQMYNVDYCTDSQILHSKFQITLPSAMDEVDTMTALLTEKAEREARERGEVDAEAIRARARQEAERRVREQLRAHQSQLDEFVRTTQEALCTEFLKDFESISAKIQGRENISKSNTKRIKSLIQNFKEMDILDLEDVRKALEEVEQVVDSYGSFKPGSFGSQNLSRALNGAMDVARKEVESLSAVKVNPLRRVV